jgi:hypothetical protein
VVTNSVKSGFKQKGQRPDSFQLGATRHVEKKQLFKGGKPDAIQNAFIE